MSLQRPSFWAYKPTAKKVSFGSPADGKLQRGDIITKVGNYDSRDIRHQDAQTLFNNAGSNIRVVIQRDPSGRRKPGSTGSSLTSPLSVSPNLSPRGGNIYSPNYSPGTPALTPYYSTPFTALDPYHYSIEEHGPGGVRSDGNSENVHVTNQPYRTTPLVLPGAKVKRDAGYTETYLRHHPNPTVRAAPHHIIDADHVLKTKVVHKQFNSPINLYSDANIADTLHKQGVGVRKPVKYNPASSETYKAIQEDNLGDNVQEVTVPPQTRVYNPSKAAPPKRQEPVYQLPKKNVNSMGESPETIHQSGSFKRLMWSVLAESNY